ncbi:MAG: ATP-NAD kinase family protein [Promethearchaeota archaeon]
MTKKKIGLIINPIAGMGGSVGLKGTDGEVYKKALELGAKPITEGRIGILLSNLKKKENIIFLTAPGKMGANLLENKDIEFQIIGEIGESTSAEDTKRIAKQIIEHKIELLVFCGGDGTARDIYDAIGMEIPVVAIPSGVKMFSSVFAINPRAAAEMIETFIAGTSTLEKEVLDINEESFRKGKLDSKLYGYLKVPEVQNLLQGGKQSSRIGKSVEENKRDIARHIIEKMENNVLYLLGPGTTVKAISEELGISKALLGIDAVYNKHIIATDINESGILELLDTYNTAEIIVSPIGGQGFIFGRGNKQFTPKVLKIIGKENIQVVATEEKMKELQCLRIDTGKIEVDEMLKGYTKVLIGYNEELIIEIEC